MSISHMKVSTRLASGFALVLVLLFVSVLLSLNRLSSMQDKIS